MGQLRDAPRLLLWLFGLERHSCGTYFHVSIGGQGSTIRYLTNPAKLSSLLGANLGNVVTEQPAVPLKGARSQLCVGVLPYAGAQIALQLCDPGTVSGESWAYTGARELRGLDGTWCLTAPSSSGAVVIQQCTGNTDQKWTLWDNPDDMQVVSDVRGYCLDVSGGASSVNSSIIAYPCQGSSNQKFTRDLTGAVTPAATAIWPRGGGNIYHYTSVPNVPATGLTEVSQGFYVISEPQRTTDVIYWSSQFFFVNGNGGYFGTQPNPSIGGIPQGRVLCSGFGTNWTSTDPNCSPGADGGAGVSCATALARTAALASPAQQSIRTSSAVTTLSRYDGQCCTAP